MDKEFWERKNRNIERRNYNNFEILKEQMEEDKAEELSDLLDKITRVRHEIHSSDDLFNCESAGYREQWEFLDSDSENGINYQLKQLGLPQMIYFDLCNLASVSNVNDILEDEGITSDDKNYCEKYNEEYDRIEEIFYTQKEKINDEIEKWLKAFDEKYGTNYCPTGADRLK